jgi:hypothetical protein
MQALTFLMLCSRWRKSWKLIVTFLYLAFYLLFFSLLSYRDKTYLYGTKEQS